MHDSAMEGVDGAQGLENNMYKVMILRFIVKCRVGLYCSHCWPCRHCHHAHAIHRCQSSSIHHRAVLRRRVAIARSIVIAPRHPSLTSHHHAFHRHPSPLCSRSIAVKLAPFHAVEEPSCHPLPSKSRCAVHCHRGAVAPSLAIKEPLRHPLPLRSRCDVPHRNGRAALTVAGVITNIRHLSRPSQASCPAGCCVASPQVAASHLPAPFIVALPFVPLVRLAGCRVSLLLTPPPPICRCLRLSLRRCLLSRPSRASRPAG